jgi:hypothetical protein
MPKFPAIPASLQKPAFQTKYFQTGTQVQPPREVRNSNTYALPEAAEPDILQVGE